MNEFWGLFASFFSLTLLVFAFLRLIAIEKRVAALSRVDAKLDLLLKAAGLEFDPYKLLSSQVTAALQHGDKLEAIKQYRAATGVGLKEAKEFIEELQRQTGRGV